MGWSLCGGTVCHISEHLVIINEMVKRAQTGMVTVINDITALVRRGFCSVVLRMVQILQGERNDLMFV